MKNIIGRINEQKKFRQILESERPEFVAVCGRRRVGKTYMIREFFEKNIVFQLSGLSQRPTAEQLKNFTQTLSLYTGKEEEPSLDWLDAFYKLEKYLLSLNDGRKVIFLDELPWFDTPNSNFIAGLEHFWNGWASTRKDIILVVCGSSTSWMMDSLINNHGGLHNRITHQFLLQPFTLHETEEMLQAKGFRLSRYEIAECYMVMGGIPFYIDLLNSTKSLAQNIDELFFDPVGIMHNEFNNLYAALFRNSNDYVRLVQVLSSCSQGLTRNDIVKKSGLKSGSALTTILKNLEYCGFIRSYTNFAYAKKDTLYQLIDFYTLFYFRFIHGKGFRDIKYWSAIQTTPEFYTWAGFSFERLCLQHIEQIKKSLGIAGVLSNVYGWRSRKTSGGAQIDLVIDRNDQTINLCEMKFSKGRFVINKKYADELQNKILTFNTEIKSNKSIQLTFVTANGIERNAHSRIVTNEVLMDDLF